MLNYAEFSIKKIIENKHLGTVGTYPKRDYWDHFLFGSIYL